MSIQNEEEEERCSDEIGKPPLPSSPSSPPRVENGSGFDKFS